MAYPIWDLDALPSIVNPFQSNYEATKIYLGGRKDYGEQYATLNILAETNEEAQALFQFWKFDCDFGTSPFMIPLPLFGVDYDRNEADVTARFIDDITMEKIDLHWTTSIRIKIIDEDILYPSLTLYPQATGLYPI